MNWETEGILTARGELQEALPVYHAWTPTVSISFGHYRNCENRLAEALEASVKPLRDCGALVMETAKAAEETAANVKAAVEKRVFVNWKLNLLFAKSETPPVTPKPAGRLKIIMKMPCIKVTPDLSKEDTCVPTYLRVMLNGLKS